MQPTAMENNRVLLLGGVLMDHCVQVGRYPEAGRDAIIERSFKRVGGCALNVAVTLNNLSSVPYIVSNLGDDEIGKDIERYMTSLSLPTSFIYRKHEEKTGYCIAIIDRTGQRTFLTQKGCETEFPKAKLPILESTEFDCIYVTGYYLLEKKTAAEVVKLVEKKQAKGCLIFFDPGPLIEEMNVSQLMKMISLTDWLIPNTTELELIQKKGGCINDPISWLQNIGCQNVVIKKGAQGADIYTNSTNISVRGFGVNATDTNGAGDSFAGGLIHALANGYSLKRAMELSSACGALTSTIQGSHGIFTPVEIDNFIARQQVRN